MKNEWFVALRFWKYGLCRQEPGNPHSRHVYNARVYTRARPVFFYFCLHLFTFWA